MKAKPIVWKIYFKFNEPFSNSVEYIEGRTERGAKTNLRKKYNKENGEIEFFKCIPVME